MDLGFRRGDAIIVTGAGSGIGRATAILAAELGLRVAAWDIMPESVAATVEAIGSNQAQAIVADVADPDSVQEAIEATGGNVRYLVNNAGPASSGSIEFSEALAAAAGSVDRVTQAWLATGPPEDAAMVSVASVAGNLVGTDAAWYCASKAAIAGYTRALATQLAPRVRVNAVAPGLIATPRVEAFAASSLGKSIVERNPMGRAGQPEDIAAVMLFLLSPGAAYVNGVLLPVDGGWTISQ